ncbi:MAG: dehydrogenase E1 component subunit alpha/beta [Bacteroidia bacterium]|nr:dehydrogenase E1 component subunit alpha/beta [Bacteroidia bacterium]
MSISQSEVLPVFDRRDLSDEQLIDLYRKLLYPRLIEEKMLILLRQGRVSKWFSGIGQEAISVGITAALRPDDYVLPLHRNLGVFTTRDMPLERLLKQWLGKPDGYTHGRDRSFHFGSPEDRVIGMISHLGAMLPVADGLALASNLDHEDYLAVAFSGDGGTSEGEFHEAVNVAAVWDLPVIFVIEQNGYGLSTPTTEQYRAEKLADKAVGYGISGYTIDGNNILEVYHVVTELAKKMREDKAPVILECVTFRMRGHEEASGTKYVPQELMETWREKDPIRRYEDWLKEEKILSEGQIELIRAELKLGINKAVESAFDAPALEPDMELELNSVYAIRKQAALPALPKGDREIRFIDAISEGLKQAMEQHPELVLMGQDIAEYGGVFKITEGFVAAFGKERVRNTPICEAAIVGAGLGLSLAGKKAMVEMQFADFVSCGFNQIVNNLAKTHYRWGHAPDVVVRMPTGGGSGAGPFHSQSNEAWFTQVPGLKVVYPSFPYDAKGLLAAAIADPNPVMYFEHKMLYRSVSGAVPEGYYELPIGKAATVIEGDSLSIVTYGMGVHWALELAKDHEGEIEVIDLRCLIPWDREAVFASVRKTGRCLVLCEATYTGSFASEIAAEVAEHCFQQLDAPVMRVASLDTPIPFHPELEKIFQPKARLHEKVEELLRY